MDKAGHLFSSYHLGRFGAEMLQWRHSKKIRCFMGRIGLCFSLAVEVMDGYSAEWGASSGDIIANAAGTALYVSQELLAGTAHPNFHFILQNMPV
jgi:hypothetical protein